MHVARIGSALVPSPEPQRRASISAQSEAARGEARLRRAASAPRSAPPRPAHSESGGAIPGESWAARTRARGAIGPGGNGRNMSTSARNGAAATSGASEPLAARCRRRPPTADGAHQYLPWPARGRERSGFRSARDPHPPARGCSANFYPPASIDGRRCSTSCGRKTSAGQ